MLKQILDVPDDIPHDLLAEGDRTMHNSHSPSQPQQQMAFFGFLYRFWIEALHNHTVDMGD